METVIKCPLGDTCEEAKGGKLYRCGWYAQLAGTGPDGKQVDEWRCAMAWMPLLMTEQAQQVRGMTAATESFRNESVKGQQTFNNLIAQAVGNAKKAIPQS